MKKLTFNIFLVFILVFFNSCKKDVKNSSELQKHKLSTRNLDSISTVLEIAYVDDQYLRLDYKRIEKEFGWDSKQAKELWQEQEKFDSINLVKVTSVIEKYGWLGINEIGEEGNSALFLVIQHSELDTQLKYLPILEKASEQGKASKSQFAYFKDRILLKQGEKQIYGTQYQWDDKKNEYYLSSVIEPKKINGRRAKVGLGTIEDFYLSHWNKEWDLEKYEQRIERIENEKK